MFWSERRSERVLGMAEVTDTKTGSKQKLEARHISSAWYVRGLRVLSAFCGFLFRRRKGCRDEGIDMT